MTLRVLMPLAGHSRFLPEEEFQVPPALIEIQGTPMIEWIVRDLERIRRPKRYLFIVSEGDCRRFSMDSVLRILPEQEPLVLSLRAPTKGALCSALMAIDHIDDDEPLLIANGDQIFDVDLDEVLDDFEKRGLDFGAICFDSVHPRWSFVRMEEDRIVEAAEKRPISRNAIAGFYWFRRGTDFVKAASRTIERGVPVGEAYYTSQAINELVLEGKRTGIWRIDAADYHSFYSKERIRDFEQLCPARMQTAAREWADAYSCKDLPKLETLLAEDFEMQDSGAPPIRGQAEALKALANAFAGDPEMQLKPSRVHTSGSTTITEFSLDRHGVRRRGVDVASWSGGLMVSLRRYLEGTEPS